MNKQNIGIIGSLIGLGLAIGALYYQGRNMARKEMEIAVRNAFYQDINYANLHCKSDSSALNGVDCDKAIKRLDERFTELITTDNLSHFVNKYIPESRR